MRLIPLVLLLMVCGGCSLPLTTVTEPAPLGIPPQSELLNIRFKRWSKPLFSGLLGIQREDDTLRYILLDGSGITLARAVVHHDGSNTELVAISKIKESGLPGYLAGALQKIYLLQPAAQPCSRTFFFKLCAEQSTTNNIKYMRAGPFTVFHINYQNDPNSEGVSTILFSQPWLGMQMTLQKLNQKKNTL